MLNHRQAIPAAASLVLILALPATSSANDFPTQARVEYVLQCAKDYGGQSYKNIYGCICMIDQIAEAMPFEDYEEATTFGNMRTVPGERSGVFRDNDRGRQLTRSIEKIRAEAASACLMPDRSGES